MRDREWFGRLPRSAPRQSKEFADQEFQRFCQNQFFIKVRNDLWRIPVFSPVAQYDEFSKFLIERPSVSSFCDEKVLHNALACMDKHFSFYMRDAGFLTWEQAIGRIRKEASCGYPLNIKYYSKKQFLEEGNAFEMYHAEIASWLTQRPLPCVFQQNAKRELRLVGKSTRTFLPGPFVHYMFQVQCFSMQNDALVHNHQRTWFGCGISPFKGGWNRLYTMLLRFGNCYFESDVSGWDRSVSSSLRWKVCEMRFKWLPIHLQTKENWQLIKQSYDFAINAFVVLEDGDLTRKYGGTSSGEYNTLDDNCLIHYLAVVLILQEMASAVGYKLTYEEICEVITCKFVGDDNLGAIKIEKWPWFTWEKFQRGYERLGFKIKYIRHGPNLMERGFLSLTFVHRYGMILGAPDREKVLCSLVYGNQYDDVQYRFLRALDFRMHCFADEGLFAVVDGWCKHLYKQHKDLIERENTDFPWSTVRGNWKSIADLVVLHCGYEAKYVPDQHYEKMRSLLH